MPKKRREGKKELVESVAKAQPTDSVNRDNPINISIMDPMTIYLCPDGSMTVQNMLTSSHFKSYLNQVLAAWGLNPNLLENPIFVPPLNSSRTSVSSWQRQVSNDAVIGVPTITFPLNMERNALGRSDLLSRNRALESSNKILADDLLRNDTKAKDAEVKLNLCLSTKASLEKKVSLLQSKIPVDQLDGTELLQRIHLRDEERDKELKLYREKIEKRDKELEVYREELKLYRKTMRERDEELKLNRETMDKELKLYRENMEERGKELEAAHKKIMSLSPQLQGVRLRVLLEKYRSYLATKYTYEGDTQKVNEWLSDLLKIKELDALDRELIPLVFSGSETLYGKLSKHHVHNADTVDIAHIVTSNIANREKLVKMFKVVFEYDPHDEVASFSFDTISL